MQRLVYPGRGILDDEFRLRHLLELQGRQGHLGPPRLILEEAADSEVQEPDAEVNPSSVARAEVPDGLPGWESRRIDWTAVHPGGAHTASRGCCNREHAAEG